MLWLVSKWEFSFKTDFMALLSQVRVKIRGIDLIRLVPIILNYYWPAEMY